jgi:hypothetical protein
MKFWNDEALLAKISQRLGGAAGAPPPGARPPPQQAPAEVTNLLEAARWNDLEAVEDFISIGKNVNEGDKDGRTPLCVPLRTRAWACVQPCVLVPAAREGRSRVRIRCRACARRRHFVVAFGQGDAGMEIAKALVQAGAKLDAVDAKQNTALHYAAGYGRPEYAALLLDAGAPVEAANDTGKTALDLVKLNSANPVGKDEAVMKRLGGGTFFRDV